MSAILELRNRQIINQDSIKVLSVHITHNTTALSTANHGKCLEIYTVASQWQLHWHQTSPVPPMAYCSFAFVYSLAKQINCSAVGWVLLHSSLHPTAFHLPRNIQSCCWFRQWHFILYLRFTCRKSRSPRGLGSTLFWLMYHYADANLVHWHFSQMLKLKPQNFTQPFLMQYMLVGYSLHHYIHLITRQMLVAS